VAREVENVHAEYSRNCNSDARKLLQLRRSSCRPPYSSFSTGSIETLRDEPAARGVDMAAQLRALWERRYSAGAPHWLGLGRRVRRPGGLRGAAAAAAAAALRGPRPQP
jgi:insulysin